jgi:hypothetical protein
MSWERSAPGVMPLSGGELRFEADQNLVSIRTVHVADSKGTVTGAWSGFGDPLNLPGLTLKSPEQLFVIRHDANTYQVYGDKVSASASSGISATLIGHPAQPLSIATKGSETLIAPKGWQRGHWFELRVR